MGAKESAQWIKVKNRRNKLTKTFAPYYLEINNQYSQLAEFAATPDPPDPNMTESDAPR